MNLVVDYGNTRIKLAMFNGMDLQQKMVFTSSGELRLFLGDHSFAHALVSSVKEDASEILEWINASGRKLQLTSTLPLPVKISYKTPHTLGVDRIAAVCGAAELYPGSNCLVIDAGTCITFDFLDASGHYRGGAISPGITMRFEAMHQLTSRLPLVSPTLQAPLIGDSTESGMQSGVMNGVAQEITGIVARYRTEFPQLQVILCGGDSGFFENILKPTIFVAPDLVLTGLNRILAHHVTN